MLRVLAHHIIFEGKDYPLSVAEISDDGSVRISPFERETPNTVFVSGTVRIPDDLERICKGDNSALI